MLIAIVDFEVAPGDRPAAVAALNAEAASVRAMAGNDAFRILVDPANDGRLTILHEWRDPDAFAGYLASETFASAGRTLRPMMTSTPLSRRFRATLHETV